MRRPLTILAAVVVAATLVVPGGVRADDPPYRTEAGPRFAPWNVSVVPHPDHPNRLELSFDSPALGLRATSLVWLPDAAYDSERPLAVAYFLHGQVDTATFGIAEVFADAGIPLPYPFAPGTGRNSSINLRLEETADVQDFLVVAIDAGERAWCGHCMYTEGRHGQGVATETHLFGEVVPLVEHLFNVRTDRGGRGIFGNSMGANGALYLGFKHPDRFSFIGALSPTLSGHETPGARQGQANVFWAGYLIDQGYGPTDTEEALYDALDPVQAAQNVLGVEMEIVAAIGDGCVPNHGEGLCSEAPPYGDFDQELGFRRSVDMWTALLTSRGVRHTIVLREGEHNSLANRDNFRRHLLPVMNRVFSTRQPAPVRFSYETPDDAFSIWGYRVSVDRPNVENLHLLGSRTDGTDFTLGGTGVAAVVTPPLPDGPGSYRVAVTPDGAEPMVSMMDTDADGRLRLEIDLGPTRNVNERRDLVASGAFQIPHTRVTIGPEVAS